MKIDKSLLEKKLKRYELAGGNFIWFHRRNPFETEIEPFIYDFDIPDENGRPNSESIDYLLLILNNLEEVQAASKKFIKGHLSVQSDFSLQSIEILRGNYRHEAEAILQFWCDEDGYLYTEIGLVELRPHYLLIKYW